MSVAYRPVNWNRNKYIYDAVALALAAGFVLAFLAFAQKIGPGETRLDDAALHMRAYGACAFLMLSAVLCIGPLARIDPRFLPLLYNRRHFGVIICAMALAHAQSVIGWYFAFSPANPFVALLSSNTAFHRFQGFPFEILGLFALLVLLVMAATSHDFWLSFLTPPVWKALHMAVYPAYAAVVAHVALGPLQGPGQAALAGVVATGAALVCGLHLYAAWLPEPAAPLAIEGWVRAGAAASIAEGRARVVPLPGGASAAIFRHEGRLSAVSNVCAHQNGPLGEGRVVDGCITCPWHGYQYRLDDGCSPPPFTEKIATYRIKLAGGEVWLDPRALPPGTPVEPLRLEEKGP